jgi:hypothetical protein
LATTLQPRTQSDGNVWNYLRSNKSGSLVWDSYDAMLEACKQTWLFLVNNPARIIAIGTRE